MIMIDLHKQYLLTCTKLNNKNKYNPKYYSIEAHKSVAWHLYHIREQRTQPSRKSQPSEINQK